MSVKPVWGLLKDSIKGWTDHSAARLGAALSYYTIFALPPLFVILIFIASLWLDEQMVRSELFGQVGGLIGAKGAQAIESTLEASNPQKQGLIASILAIGTLILTATGLFIELQSDLNQIWGVKAKPGQGIWGFIKVRLLSFGTLVGIGFLLLVSLVISAALSAAGKYFTGFAPGLNVLWMVFNFAFSFLVITALFAMIFKVLPDIKIAWRDVWVGAGLTALLFTIGKFLLGLYLGKNSTVSAYGAAGSLVLILLWVYYSGQILFFGAEFTRVYANRFGVKPQPKLHAEWISPPQETKQEKPTKANAEPEEKSRTPAYARTHTDKAGGRKEELVGEIREEVESLRELVER
jgi:membrane protein